MKLCLSYLLPRVWPVGSWSLVGTTWAWHEQSPEFIDMRWSFLKKKTKNSLHVFQKIWVGFSQTPFTGYIHRPYSQDGRPFASDITLRIGRSNVVLLCSRVASHRKMRESDKSLSRHCFPDWSATGKTLEMKNPQGHQPHFTMKQHIR